MNAMCLGCTFNDVAIHPGEIIAFCRHRVDGFPNRQRCEQYINIEDGFEIEETAQARIQRQLKMMRES